MQHKKVNNLEVQTDKYSRIFATNKDLKMCDVCKKNKMDYRFLNGKKAHLAPSQFYQVQVGKVSVLRLCYIHDIQLFHLGERRFINQHKALVPLLKSRLT